ncbi:MULTISPECIES: hypothetical protein [Bacillus]|uniref:hypothetical protein n=1 Tax=Bacillus TaxID=1386 RepID=UPI000BB813BF|nr:MULTISPECIES: hypothetical protein [Bacillus]
MIFEILANIGISMQMFLRGMPEDDKVNKNIERLKSTDWFQEIYKDKEDFFSKNEDVRYLIGWAKVDKDLKNEKRANRLREKILSTLNN